MSEALAALRRRRFLRSSGFSKLSVRSASRAEFDPSVSTFLLGFENQSNLPHSRQLLTMFDDIRDPGHELTLVQLPFELPPTSIIVSYTRHKSQTHNNPSEIPTRGCSLLVTRQCGDLKAHPASAALWSCSSLCSRHLLPGL